MTFAFYHSLVSQPRDLDEAARIMRLTRWERFWRLDVPSGMIPLVWNGMLSFGGDGKEFAAADILTSKQLFARHAAKYAPLVRTITQALATTADHTLRIGFFIDILRRDFSLGEAHSQLDTAIDWGRYAELYDYDSDDEELTLEPGAQEYL
jgi:NitT/TauT family transport system ATP-binding protein